MPQVTPESARGAQPKDSHSTSFSCLLLYLLFVAVRIVVVMVHRDHSGPCQARHQYLLVECQLDKAARSSQLSSRTMMIQLQQGSRREPQHPLEYAHAPILVQLIPDDDDESDDGDADWASAVCSIQSRSTTPLPVDPFELREMRDQVMARRLERRGVVPPVPALAIVPSSDHGDTTTTDDGSSPLLPASILRPPTGHPLPAGPGAHPHSEIARRASALAGNKLNALQSGVNKIIGDDILLDQAPSISFSMLGEDGEGVFLESSESLSNGWMPMHRSS